MDKYKVTQIKNNDIELTAENLRFNMPISNSILEIVQQKEEDFRKEFPLIEKIETESYQFCFEIGKMPTEIRMSIKMYEDLVRVASFNQVGSVMPNSIRGMEIVIDDSLKDFDLMCYENFMGMRKVIRC